VAVLLQPLDVDSNPVGESFSVVTRDISSRGVGLIATQPIHPGLVALRMNFAHEEVAVIAEVRWSTPMGPFEAAGCRFVRKIGD
jgi:hypothetical protein